MYTYLNIPQGLTSIHFKPLPAKVSWAGSAEEVGCFALIWLGLQKIRTGRVQGKESFQQIAFQ